MKILVIEDKEIHRQSAVETLAGHDVTIVSSFDAGIEAMSTALDPDILDRLKKADGLAEISPEGGQEREAWLARYDELTEQAHRRPDFEAVLVDMMMPMSSRSAAGSKTQFYQFGVEVPYGFILALRAAQIGAKYIAMLTDTNHHHGAMSASLDHIETFGGPEVNKPFEINGAKALFLHAPFVEEAARRKVWKKDWGRVLKHLLRCE
jgi:CheY-like chemotaxis protein